MLSQVVNISDITELCLSNIQFRSKQYNMQLKNKFVEFIRKNRSCSMSASRYNNFVIFLKLNNP